MVSMGGKFDDIDRDIVNCLVESPRARNTAIGARLGLRPDLVSTRIRSMMERGHLRVMAFADARVFGHRQIARVQFRVDGTDVEAFAKKISTDDRFLSVALTTGEFQISTFFGLSAKDHLPTIANELLAELEGVTACRWQPVKSMFRCEPGRILPA